MARICKLVWSINKSINQSTVRNKKNQQTFWSPYVNQVPILCPPKLYKIIKCSLWTTLQLEPTRSAAVGSSGFLSGWFRNANYQKPKHSNFHAKYTSKYELILQTAYRSVSLFNIGVTSAFLQSKGLIEEIPAVLKQGIQSTNQYQ